MGILDNDHAVISFPTSKVAVTSFSTTGGRRRGTTTVRVDFEVNDPWQLADLVRDIAEIRAAACQGVPANA